MPNIRVKENEPLDVALRRFKRACEKAGTLSELRRREAYEKPTAVRKRKHAAAIKRHLKKTSRDNPFAGKGSVKKFDRRRQHMISSVAKPDAEAAPAADNNAEKQDD